MDVKSLYTSIMHSDELKHFLNKRVTKEPSRDTLIRLAELVLNKNTFSFSNEVFSQASAITMGTKMSPSYACIFMGHFEYLLLQQYNKRVPKFYKRYIDDIIGVTSMNSSQLLDFINFVQNFHPTVKFTYQISKTSITFLNMNISLKQGILSTSIHYRTTDSHSYLDYRSSHNPSNQNQYPIFPVPQTSPPVFG